MMTDHERRETLQRLYEELEHIQAADEKGRQFIANARADVRRALDRTEANTTEDESLIERLQDALYHFEGTHPDLTATLSAVINSLSNMGL